MLSGVFTALGRRWYVVLVGLVATAALVWGGLLLSPVRYTARSLTVLLPPVSEEAQNPFLSIGGLEVPARIVVAALSGATTLEEIARRAPDAEVVVSIEEATRGPVIAIDVEDVTASSALSTLAYVSGLIPSSLEQLQDEVDAPPQDRVGSLPLTVDTVAEPDPSDAIRTALLIGVVGVALSVAAAVGIENLSLRPRRRRAAGAEPLPDARVATPVRKGARRLPRPARSSAEASVVNKV